MSFHPWHDVELPRYVEEAIPAIIEIPTGSKVKYELDKASGLLRVDRILFSAVHYPANYGFVPRTYCDDGDPLDILVYCQEHIVPLAIMQAKIIGVMRMRDDKGEDDKLVAVSADDPEYADISDISEMPTHRMRELKRFFEDYKALEHKKVLVREPQGRAHALEVLRGGHPALRPGGRPAAGRHGPAPQEAQQGPAGRQRKVGRRRTLSRSTGSHPRCPSTNTPARPATGPSRSWSCVAPTRTTSAARSARASGSRSSMSRPAAARSGGDGGSAASSANCGPVG